MSASSTRAQSTCGSLTCSRQHRQLQQVCHVYAKTGRSAHKLAPSSALPAQPCMLPHPQHAQTPCVTGMWRQQLPTCEWHHPLLCVCAHSGPQAGTTTGCCCCCECLSDPCCCCCLAAPAASALSTCPPKLPPPTALSSECKCSCRSSCRATVSAAAADCCQLLPATSRTPRCCCCCCLSRWSCLCCCSASATTCVTTACGSPPKRVMAAHRPFVRLLLGVEATRAAPASAAASLVYPARRKPQAAAAKELLALSPPYCAASRASAALRLALFVLAVAAGEHALDAGPLHGSRAHTTRRRVTSPAA